MQGSLFIAYDYLGFKKIKLILFQRFCLKNKLRAIFSPQLCVGGVTAQFSLDLFYYLIVCVFIGVYVINCLCVYFSGF